MSAVKRRQFRLYWLTMPIADQKSPARLVRAGAARPDHRIERTLHVTHSLNYSYSRPARDVTTRLRLLPPPWRGAQHLLHSSIHRAPVPTRGDAFPDAFGNELLQVFHDKVWENLTFVIELTVETAAAYGDDGRVLPEILAPEQGVPPEGAGVFRQDTPLTRPDAALEAVAADIARGYAGGDTASLALALCRRVFSEMRFVSGETGVGTTAAEAWGGKKGVCQDYTHILLALCRLVDLPARYVSGFLPGEGAMHAWVEVLLPENEGGPGGWAALDPTHDRWVNERYVAVAAGRDYGDISPTSGTYIGVGPSSLSHRSRVSVEKTVRVSL